jgi:hypothetical protein
MRQDPLRRFRSSLLHSASPSVAVETPAQAQRLSLHRYGSASRVHRYCRNASSRFSPGFGCCINSSPSLSRLVAHRASRQARPPRWGNRIAMQPLWLSHGAQHRFVVVSLCRPPCPAQGLRARLPCSVRSFSGSVDGAAHNRSVEATSNGWPHMASCSFLALCGQSSAAPHLER